ESEEGTLPGLNWLDAKTVRFRFENGQTGLKVPHMGWNDICARAPNRYFDQNAGPPPRFYFAHSYHVVCEDAHDVLATTCYGYDFASVVQRDNITGVQFHPEKSHT